MKVDQLGQLPYDATESGIYKRDTEKVRLPLAPNNSLTDSGRVSPRLNGGVLVARLADNHKCPVGLECARYATCCGVGCGRNPIPRIACQRNPGGTLERIPQCGFRPIGQRVCQRIRQLASRLCVIVIDQVRVLAAATQTTHFRSGDVLRLLRRERISTELPDDFSAMFLGNFAVRTSYTLPFLCLCCFYIV